MLFAVYFCCQFYAVALLDLIVGVPVSRENNMTKNVVELLLAIWIWCVSAVSFY
jgi:hypothetical protein